MPDDKTAGKLNVTETYVRFLTSTSDMDGEGYTWVDPTLIPSQLSTVQLQSTLIDSATFIAPLLAHRSLLLRRIALFQHKTFFSGKVFVLPTERDKNKPPPLPKPTSLPMNLRPKAELDSKVYSSLISFFTAEFCSKGISAAAQVLILEIAYEWSRCFPHDMEGEEMAGGMVMLTSEENVNAAKEDQMHSQIIARQKSLRTCFDKSLSWCAALEEKREKNLKKENLSNSLQSAQNMQSFSDLWVLYNYKNLSDKMFALDTEQFLAINPRELLNKAWVRDNATERAPAVLAMIDTFNNRSFWAASEILRYHSIAKRVVRRNFFFLFLIN